MTKLHERILTCLRLSAEPLRLIDVARELAMDPSQIRVAVLSLEKRGLIIYDKYISLTATYDPLGADAAQLSFETYYPDCVGGSFNIGFKFGWEAAIMRIKQCRFASSASKQTAPVPGAAATE